MHQVLMNAFTTYGSLSGEEIAAIDATMHESIYPKDHILLRQGETSVKVYFVLEGVVRKYYAGNGGEKTSNFFTPGQWVVSLPHAAPGSPSSFFLQCSTGCKLAVGDNRLGEELYTRFPNLANIARKLIEDVFVAQQLRLETFLVDTVEERYIKLMRSGSDLFQLVPQYQVASYIGVAPESLSRIRKRISLR